MEKRHASPSGTMLVPYSHRQLAVLPPIAASSRFKIPRGWGVEEVPRPDGSHTDMYYYEPGTGRKFRSIREVQRYLNGEGYPRRATTRKLSIHSHNSGDTRMVLSFKKSSRYRRLIVSGGKLFRLDNELSQNQLAMVASGKAVRRAPYILRDGWIVEEVPRRFDNLTDKYYYEPETGQKFRSLVAVERYLAELDENAPLSKALEEIKENKPLAKIFKLEHHTKSSSPRKKNISKENTQASSFNDPPMKVNWVLASPQGDAWNPFISEALVPDAVKQEWTNRFMLFTKDGISNFQSFEA